MNRLILVGNGFDLAHQMKTSYKDFLLDYLNRAFKYCDLSTNYTDSFMRVTKNNLRNRFYPPFEGTEDIGYFKKFLDPNHVAEVRKAGDTDPLPRENWQMDIVNPFIKHLFLHCCEYKWVDIENEYYRELKGILINVPAKEKDAHLQKLNEAFQTLSQMLDEYLSTLQFPTTSPEFNGVFFDSIKVDDVVIEKLEMEVYPEKYMILNFNYTSTVEAYLRHAKKDLNIQLNYIHGQLSKNYNPIIFGFGDEHDADYPLLEKETNPGFLTYMKSFWYFKTRNYHELIRFIESDSFQVVIAGHSCGLSDRTMLKMILEHANCKSIKIWYFENAKKNNYGVLTQELSRHFTNKAEMREKIVPFPLCKPLPQITGAVS